MANASGEGLSAHKPHTQTAELPGHGAKLGASTTFCRRPSPTLGLFGTLVGVEHEVTRASCCDSVAAAAVSDSDADAWTQPWPLTLGGNAVEPASNTDCLTGCAVMLT